MRVIVWFGVLGSCQRQWWCTLSGGVFKSSQRKSFQSPSVQQLHTLSSAVLYSL